VRAWLETTGRAHHGAQPDRGDNAIYKLLPLAQALRDEVAAEFAARRHAVLGKASLNLGVIQGGRDLNIVPDAARAGVDIRWHPELPEAEVVARLELAIREHSPGATLRLHRTGPAFVTARTEPWARALRRAGRGWATADWFCDANIFAAHGVPAVAFGPGDIAQAHTKDEYITTRALADGAGAFGAFLASSRK
jgi:acetylornithine deacetylase/succinyl-diaminopimelate desuccinylase-like protein